MCSGYAQRLYGVRRAGAGRRFSSCSSTADRAVILTDLVRSFFAPKAWCALERDSELTQAYVVDEEE